MIQILLAEDNTGDVMLVKEALAAHDIESELHVVEDGQKALDFVATMGGPGCGPCPDLMLLDMNLPKADGSAILAAFRKHQACRATPVIVVTSSDTAKDKQAVSALGISHYFRKPSDFDEFMELGAIIKQVLRVS